MKRHLATAAVIVLLVVASTSWARRSLPPEVAPVENGKYFITAGSDAGGIKVHDPKTRTFLWKMLVYNIQLNRGMETDIQQVYITKLDLKDDTLKVANEDGDEYEVNLKTMKSRAIKGSLLINMNLRYSEDASSRGINWPDSVYDNEYSTCEECDTITERFTKVLKKK